VDAGGSGCGCSAVVLNGYFVPLLRRGDVRRILFVATGALMSPVSTQQGESIPGIAHAVSIRGEGVSPC
jgi:stage V sporulation protein AD